jgi:hypothetical protein
VLDGKQVVFLSCMTADLATLARPLRDRLNGAGYRALIVMDEPLLQGAFTVKDKVGGYLQAGDAFVVLATADDRADTGTAADIIDEIRRARMMPNLRDVVLIMKELSVTLPSDIAPAWEPLDPDDPNAAFDIIRKQLDAWGVVAANAPTPAPLQPLAEGAIDLLFVGVGVGDNARIDARLRRLFGRITKQDQRRVAQGIFERLLTLPSDSSEIRIAGGFLEAAARIDAALIEPDWLAQLVESQMVQHRICAVSILQDWADVDPGSVPLDYIAKLARPSTEDWYVYAPAIAAAKELALTRRPALEILLDLARSPEVNDRFTAVHALRSLADVDAAVVWIGARGRVARLARDPDDAVAGPASELLDELREQFEELQQARRVPDRYGHFAR